MGKIPLKALGDVVLVEWSQINTDPTSLSTHAAHKADFSLLTP
jgi:hypothetical protein